MKDMLPKTLGMSTRTPETCRCYQGSLYLKSIHRVVLAWQSLGRTNDIIHIYVHAHRLVTIRSQLAHQQDNRAQLPPDISIVDVVRVLDFSPLLGLMQNF
jgi:hypothetical protein